MKKVSEVSPRLYHYTNEQGLYGILDNQCLWATHYKFLNDYSEIVLFRDKLIEFLYPSTLDYFKDLIPKYPNAQEVFSSKGGLDAVVKQELETFVDASYEYLNDEIYITSFAGEHSDPFINEHGLLSQWRGYAEGGGFAIVFKTEELDEMLGSEHRCFHYTNHACIADVIYSDIESIYKSELSELLHKISVYQKEVLEQISQRTEKMPDNMTEIYKAFISCITRYKHRGFKEEQEFRIVSMPTVFNRDLKKIVTAEDCNSKLEKERKFRVKNGQQTPYIELFRSLKTQLPIEKIIVGPHKDKHSRAAALRIMLRNTDIKVTVSEIPYQ